MMMTMSCHLAPSSGERVTRALSLDTRSLTNSGTRAEGEIILSISVSGLTPDVSAQVSADCPRVHREH